MRIAFVHRLYENLGIEYLSAYLKKAGHDVCLFFDPALFDNYLLSNKELHKVFSYRDILIHAIVKDNPDIVAFSVSSSEYAWACDIAKAVKERTEAVVVYGGAHPTAVLEEVLKNDFVDFVICGEGEEAMMEFVNSFTTHKDVRTIRNLG